jgi:glycosyltransferase involved in cell wall biosynthesis
MGRKIDIIANDGSPLGVTEKTLMGDDPNQMGCGGAEEAILTLCRAWQFYENDVTFYNNPNEGGASSFKQKTLDEFCPQEDRDILIVFRSPNERIKDAKGKKIWFSCDQYTIGSFKDFAPQVDKIVCISDFHKNYFNTMYGIGNTTVIDLPVRTWEYDEKVPKVSHRCIFTSIPDRGLMCLHAAWPQIIKEVPDTSLVITSDWRLWSRYADAGLTNSFRVAFAGHPNITYLGAVKRKELIHAQMEADLLTYSCTYEELFAIAVAEAQVAGALPVTSDVGALATTNMARIIHGNPTQPQWIELFVKNVVELLTDSHLKEKQEHIKEVARKRFAIETILPQWESVFDS